MKLLSKLNPNRTRAESVIFWLIRSSSIQLVLFLSSIPYRLNRKFLGTKTERCVLCMYNVHMWSSTTYLECTIAQCICIACIALCSCFKYLILSRLKIVNNSFLICNCTYRLVTYQFLRNKWMCHTLLYLQG